ncbi:MAG: hypothetical protein IT269_08745 [Saprospiraceae bacterium]|nr:hypothetical protein [Saprospiraceae bacterium]
MRLIIPFVIVFCCAAVVSTAQTPGTPGGFPVPPLNDSTHLEYTLSATPEISTPDIDTLPDSRFRTYDPVRRQQPEWGNLGNVGSAARPLLFDVLPHQGYRSGMEQFDAYRLRPEALRYYKNSRSFSDVFFSQGRNQEENLVRANFSRTFEKGTVVALDYRSFNYLGQYQYQRTKHNLLSVGIWVPLGRRYEGFLVFNKNTFRQNENGGIVTDTVFGQGQFGGPIAATIQLPEYKAKSRLGDQSWYLTQHFRIAGKKGDGGRLLRLTHTAQRLAENFKFTDATPSADAAFFENFLTDTRGVRQYFESVRWDNAVSLTTFRQSKSGKNSDLLAAGLSHSYIHLQQEPTDTTFYNLFATGQVGLSFSETFRLRGEGALGLLANFGEYRLKADIELGLGQWARLSAGLQSQIAPPSLMSYRLFVTEQALWQNDFKKPIENALWGRLSLPKWGFSATLRTHLINNYLYFDQQARAAQTSSPVQIAQLIFQENLRWRALRLDNTIAVQQSNRLDDVLRLPQWMSQNSLYFSGRVFKKRMQLEMGLDFRMNADFRPDAWQPVTGQFYLQDSLKAKAYPWVDAFASFKIKNFRFFFRYDNLNTLLDDTKVMYHTAYMPQQFGAIRLGIGWRFIDRNQQGQDSAPGGAPSGSGSGGPPIGIRGQ